MGMGLETAPSPSIPQLDKSVLREFFGHICKKKDKARAYLDPVVFHAFQHVGGYKSAIKNFYSNKEVIMSLDIQKMLKQLFEGCIRTVTKLKQEEIMPIVEGKPPMSFRGYKFLAQKAVEQTKDYNLAIFSHLYLLLCLNLIARCVSVGRLMYNHISWENDFMIIVFLSHKGDKEGRNALPKDIYANIVEPTACPILSFAVYIFTRGFEREDSKMTLFAGDTESRFIKWLSNLCQTNKDMLLNHGVDISMIGTHSFRIRGVVGDQVCGRAASGLSLTDVSFANLPSHFLRNNEECLSTAEWEDILPGFSTLYPKKRSCHFYWHLLYIITSTWLSYKC